MKTWEACESLCSRFEVSGCGGSGAPPAGGPGALALVRLTGLLEAGPPVQPVPERPRDTTDGSWAQQDRFCATSRGLWGSGVVRRAKAFPWALDGASAVAPRCRVARPGSGALGWNPGFILLWVCPDGVLRGRAPTALAGMSTSPVVLARGAVGTAPTCPPVEVVGVVRGTSHRLRDREACLCEVTALGVTCHPSDTPGGVVDKAAPRSQSGREAGIYSSPGVQSQERWPEPPPL